MESLKLIDLDVNGLKMRVAEQGRGPLVLFCHGWPESWYSWRHQLAAVAAAGFRAVAPDMRGYGGTDAPDEVGQYTMLHLVGDAVGLVHALGEKSAVIVGHDWGAPVAWNATLMRPDVFGAVVGLSVPFSPPGRVDLLTALTNSGISRFYLQYFQAPGVAEKEFDIDPVSTLRQIYVRGSGDYRGQEVFGILPDGAGFLHPGLEANALPAWLSEADLEFYADQFRRAGFAGGLNWYRNLRTTWELLTPWRGATISRPSLFIAGSRDGVLKFSESAASKLPATLPGLRGLHIIEGAGHWIQQERPDEVNKLIVSFLQGL